MPALKPTAFSAEVVWLGAVADIPTEKSIRSGAVSALDLGFEGMAGARHSGLTRPACSRTMAQHPRGTEIRNVRQLSIVSQEELDAIAAQMGLERLAPEALGASIVLRGIPDLSHLPPSSRLQTAEGTTLAVDMENRPCHLPGKEIEKDHAGYGRAFKDAAKGRRGVTAWVERPGRLRIGDVVRLHVPDQPVWPHLDRARQEG